VGHLVGFRVLDALLVCIIRIQCKQELEPVIITMIIS
jgi:hypothetical protein